MITVENWNQMAQPERATLLGKVALRDSSGVATGEFARKMWETANQYGMTAKAIKYLLLLSGYDIPCELKCDDVLPFARDVLSAFAEASPLEICLAVVNAFEEA